MIYAQPGQPDCKATFKPRYENYINGKWVPPITGRYSEDIAPAIGKPFCEVPCSGLTDVEAALDATYAAKDAWGQTSPADRAASLNKIADRIEANAECLAIAEAWDKGKVIREVTGGDIPLAIDTFRYYAALRSHRRAHSSGDGRARDGRPSGRAWAETANHGLL